jgi:hypothetical protein
MCLQLALLLFAMARCGNFVTLWTLAKLGKYHHHVHSFFSLEPLLFLQFTKHTQKWSNTETIHRLKGN